jgi:hypothetical protein
LVARVATRSTRAGASSRPSAEATPAAVERLARGVIEACKQCGRDTLMEIAPPRSVAEIARDPGHGVTLVVADRDGLPLDTSAGEGRPIIAVVGPEGGLTAEELAAVEAAGGTMDNVAKLTIFVTDISKNVEVWRARKEFFSGDFPAASLVEVSALATPEILVEIEAVAVLGQ